MKLHFKNKSFVCTFYTVECETAWLVLLDIERLGIISVHCISILVQEPAPIHVTKGEQIDSNTGTYKQTGLMNNTCRTKHSTDLDKCFVDDREKEYGMPHSVDFTQTMIKKYLNVLIGIGKLDGTVKINIQDGIVPHQASPRRVAYTLHKPLHEELDRQTNQTKNYCSFTQMRNQNGATHLFV